MKKRLQIMGIFLLTFLLCLSFIKAEQTLQNSSFLNYSSDELKQITTSVKDKQNDFFSSEIILPEKVNNFLRILFGLNQEDKLSIQFSVVLLCIIISSLVLFRSLSRLIPSFTSSSSWIGGAVITFILSLIGFLKLIAFSLLEALDFGFLKGYAPIKVLLIIILITGTTFLLNKVLIEIRKARLKNVKL